jgi:two-component system, OmpR family, alkaline phosphatase synthesis response regulator PhoP
MKILVADDDPITLDSLCVCLSLEGYQVIPARHGGEALDLWRSRRPDLVCLDVMMPERDGFDVCRCIRKEDAGVPILFLSAKNEEIDIVLGLELGADDFIRKPFGRHELLARVRAALRRRAAPLAETASFPFGPLTIFPKELRAEKPEGGTKRHIDLTPREVALLTVLREHQGCPVPRDTFLDRCWGVEYYPESRTLDQPIATLRRKIEENHAEPVLIETSRGVRYRHPR